MPLQSEVMKSIANDRIETQKLQALNAIARSLAQLVQVQSNIFAAIQRLEIPLRNMR